MSLLGILAVLLDAHQPQVVDVLTRLQRSDGDISRVRPLSHILHGQRVHLIAPSPADEDATSVADSILGRVA